MRRVELPLLLVGVLVATLGIVTLGCSLRDGIQRHEAALYAATAADLGTTKVGLDRGGREANPVLAEVMDAGGFAAMVAIQLGVNELALGWERRACRNLESRNCWNARVFRRALTGVHIGAAGWNAAQLLD